MVTQSILQVTRVLHRRSHHTGRHYTTRHHTDHYVNLHMVKSLSTPHHGLVDTIWQQFI